MPKLPPRETRRRESHVIEDVRAALANMRVVHWHNPVGGAHAPSGHWVNYGLCDGSADLIACVRTSLSCTACGAPLAPIGRFVGIETKHPTTGRHRPEQEAWAAIVNESHGVAGFARSAPEAVALVQRARVRW